eukprot:TRINITY_DN47723_c0_g1_i1.p1 TRINITY_DN47723_c0_g1~~TRINITY_DN47723_c0_g1_i1.p1  ORF type:complete len:564 (+),score=140.62 TRINITY_DN47723_c0_g1_i1:85-1776(+)
MLCALYVLGVAAGNATQTKMWQPHRTTDGYRCPGCPMQSLPDQLRLSYGGDGASITVTWVTYAAPTRPYVRFAPLRSAVLGDARGVIAHVTNLTRPGSNSEQYVHRAALEGLAPDTRYLYQVGDYWTGQPAGTRGYLSDLRHFETHGDGWEPNLLFAADIAVDTALPAALLSSFAKDGRFDAAFHAGDIAYSLVKRNGTVGDRWMRTLAPWAANLPYMVTPGDHDVRWGTDAWDVQQRYAMPGWRSVADTPGAQQGHWGGLWWSVDVGPVHVVSYNTEMWTTHEERGMLRTMFSWLAADLRRANRNRDRVPWIVTVAHMPMYTSGRRKRMKIKNRRTGKMMPQRVGAYDPRSANHRAGPMLFPGIPDPFPFKFERLLHDAGVDIAFQGHWHNYERFLPTFDSQARPGPLRDEPYTDAKAAVHVNIGHGGRGFEPFDEEPLPFSAARSDSRGFGILSATPARLEWTAYECGWENCTASVADRFVLRRTKRPRARRHRQHRPAPADPCTAFACGGSDALLASLRRKRDDIAAQVHLLERENARLREMVSEAAADRRRAAEGGGVR